MNDTVSIGRWIARYARVAPAAGLYLVLRCLGFRHFGRLERLVPRRGRVLDLGCGYGLFAILCGARGPDREVLGIDFLESRLRVGRRLLARPDAPANVRLMRGDLERLPEGPFDAITISDVLMYRTLGEQRRILGRCRERLAPGGRLVIAEQVRTPAWKARLVAWQEWVVLSAKLVLLRSRAWDRIAPDGIALWEASDLERVLTSSDLRVRGLRLDRLSYLSHHLFIGVRMAGGSRRQGTAPVALQAGESPSGPTRLPGQ